MSAIEGSERHIEGCIMADKEIVWIMRDALSELVALVRGECPRLLDEDSGGDVRLSMRIDELLALIEDAK